MTRIFYSDNGSTAVEVALKMAYQYWKNQGQDRRTFIALNKPTMAITIGAMSVSEESIFTVTFQRFLFTVVRVMSPDCYRCPLGLKRESCRIDCLEDLETTYAQGPQRRRRNRRADASGRWRHDCVGQGFLKGCVSSATNMER